MLPVWVEMGNLIRITKELVLRLSPGVVAVASPMVRFPSMLAILVSSIVSGVFIGSY